MEGRMTANVDQGVDSIASLSREGYRDISLYAVPRGDVALDLSDNTNLWGAPPAALRAIAAAREESISRYPGAYEPALAAAFARHVGVSADMIACGCGSGDGLDFANRGLGPAGRNFFPGRPSFSHVPSVRRP